MLQKGPYTSNSSIVYIAIYIGTKFWQMNRVENLTSLCDQCGIAFIHLYDISPHIHIIGDSFCY